MALVRLPQEVIDDYLMSRSVMDAPRNAFQQLTDVLFGRTFPEQATNAFTSLLPLRIGVLPGRERIAGDIIKRGLKEPWFHGTQQPESILRGREIIPEINWLKTPVEIPLPRRGPPGFDPSRVGSAYGVRIGEPAGVSLTRSPEVARNFGDVLRVGVDIPPSSVGQFVDPEFQRLLKEGYSAAHETPFSGSLMGRFDPKSKTMGELLKTGTKVGEISAGDIRAFNQAMSDYLRSKGVEGIAYSPRRWGEYELRVLDPSKAVPLGRLDIPAGGYSSPTPDLMQRYLYGRPTVPPDVRGKMGQLYELYRNAPEFPSRLRHVLEGTLAD